MKTMKEINNHLKGTEVAEVLTSKRGNVYNCLTVERKLLEKLMTFKKTVVQSFEVNSKKVYACSLWNGETRAYDKYYLLLI